MHQIHTSHIEGFQFNAQIDKHTIQLDTPDEPGKDAGPSPKKLMLVALAGCTGIDVVSLLTKMKVVFSDFNLDVSANLTDDHPQIYKDVLIQYYIRVSKSDEPKMHKAVNLSIEKYCGVSAMFSAFSKVSHQVTFLD